MLRTMPRAQRLILPLAVLGFFSSASLAACGGGGGDASPSGAPPGAWTWIDVPGTQCGDGTATGIAVNRASAEDASVLVFLDGGGACWQDAGDFTCGEGTARAGPYGAAQLADALLTGLDDRTILDRTVAGTPFAGATLVYVPYCTGDVHWGESAPTYPGGVWRHAGARNLELDVAWMRANLRAPEKLVVAGSSAGGFGAFLAHDLARKAWPHARGYLVDDSGPLLLGDDVPAADRSAWYASWNLDATLGELCGAACEGDLSQAIVALQARWPGDRIALVSSLQDVTARGFLGYATGDDYQAALLRLVDLRFSGGDAHAFLVPGTGHGLLGGVGSQNADGTSLSDWLRQMTDDERGWSTLGHP